MIRILYIDDEPDIREVAEMSLGIDPELDVRLCGSCAEALPVARDWQPALILLDFMMPGMDGPATLRALRDQGSNMPIVFITARTSERDVEQLLALGAAGVLAKPFDPMALASEARQFL